MLLGSDGATVLLINAKIKGDQLIADLFFADPTKAATAIVSDQSKAPVYKVWLPSAVANSATYVTGQNVAMLFERIL